MANMSEEVYDALLYTGDDPKEREERARKAARAVAERDKEHASLRTQLAVVQAPLGANMVLTAGVLWLVIRLQALLPS